MLEKRYKLYVAKLLLLGALLLAGCSGAALKNPENLCDIFEQNRGWYKASRKAEKKWGIPLQIPMAIMYQESTFRRRAKPPRKWYLGFIPGPRPSSAYGYAQVLDGTWREYLKATGDYWRTRTSFEDSVDFIQYYLVRARRENGVGKNDPYHFYLNYHEGIAGFRRKRWLGKKWLLNTAVKVKNRSERYGQQFADCKKSLDKGWLRRLMGI